MRITPHNSRFVKVLIVNTFIFCYVSSLSGPDGTSLFFTTRDTNVPDYSAAANNETEGNGMKKEWAQVSCEVPASLVDSLSEYLIELSSTGVSIDNLTLDTFSLDSIEDSPTKTVTAYFAVDDSLEERIRDIESYLTEKGPTYDGFEYRAPTVTRIKDEDWSSNWKDHFKPLRIGNRLVIKPTWESFPATGDDIILELDPGMAFGTGTHPTTMLCLSILEGILSGENIGSGSANKKYRTVLDVGTGSGILSIAAALLGAESVTAIDIDPDTIPVATDNCILNRVASSVTASDTPLHLISGSFDVILANILAEELVRLAQELVQRLSPDGILILSGILTEKEDLVVGGFSNFNVTLSEIAREGEWSCIVFRGNG
jgi:ribosomal protein L11 methyltransferase